jgi:serine kinase of HPr protein (carbohydrate metabolism regulator)
VHDGRLVAAAPEAIAGKLEIRGQGIVNAPHVSPVAIGLVVDLLPLADCPRLPTAEEMSVAILDVRLPRLMLPIGAPDGPVRVRAAVRRLGDAAPR